jgi:predicted acyl esterase
VIDAGVARRFNVRIPLRDGVTLSADLALPGALPAPAVVVRTPYGKTGERNSQRAAMLAKAGYACASVDVRGRGDSDGEFQPYRNDGPDGAEVIAWAAAQDWCTGDVATYGASYGGRIQWLTALEQPPALRAMVCVVSPSDPFVEWPTGLPTPMHINWFRATDGRMPQFIDDVDWMQVYRHRPLLTMDKAAGFSAPRWREELRHRPDDYHGVESRGDVLVFTSDPLPEPLEIIGPVKVVAHVATSAADTDITAKLLDVHPGGFAQRLCDGIVRLRYRDGFDAERPVTPGDIYEVEIRMWDTCVRLPSGHRLRVEIASSAFPKFDVNLGTGGDMITETEGAIATNRLWHTPSRPSRLILN